MAIQGPSLSGNAKIYRDHFLAASGEYIGTTMFLFFAYAWQLTVTNLAPNADPAQTVLYICLGYSLSLMINVWIFYRISGGIFNPAVALGLNIVGAITWQRTVLVVPAQLLGSITAAGLASGLFGGHIVNTSTGLNPETSVVRGLFIEMFTTSVLMITILMVAVEKSRTTFIAPVAIGVALFIGQLAGAHNTGASLNPARSFGPAVVAKHFGHEHWIYWLGPVMGCLLSSGYYCFIKYLRYEEVNPNQDSDGRSSAFSSSLVENNVAHSDEESVRPQEKRKLSVQSYAL